MTNRLIALFFCLAGSLAAAPTDFTRPLTLIELVDIALDNNPATRQAWWNAHRAAAALGVAKSAYYPHLNIVGNLSHGKEFQFIDGPDVEFSEVDADLTLNLLLCDFGQTAASVRQAKMALRASCWHTDWAMQQVMIKIIEEAYSTIHAQATLLAATLSLEDAQKMLYTAKELNRVGLKAITDVYTSQATQAQMQMEVLQKQALLDIQRGKLASKMGLSADTTFELETLDETEAPKAEELATLIACANARRADLMAKQARVCESVAHVAKTKAAFLPKISLSGRGGAEHYFNDPAAAGHYEFGVKFEVPLFHGFEKIYKHRQALAEMRISCADLAQLELDIALEVLTHSRSLQAVQKMLPYAQDNLDNAEKAYAGVLNKYKAGHEGIAEVSNALRQLANARLRFSDVKTRLYTSMANLAYATGTLPPYVMVPCEH